jgi:hypothetical protein
MRDIVMDSKSGLDTAENKTDVPANTEKAADSHEASFAADEKSPVSESITELYKLEQMQQRGEHPVFDRYSQEVGWAGSLREKVGEEEFAKAYSSGDYSRLEKIVNSTSADPDAWKSLSDNMEAYSIQNNDIEKRNHGEAINDTLDGIMNPYTFTDESRARLKDGIRNGDIGEREIRKIGEPLRERYSEVQAERLSELSELQNERADLVRQQIFAKDAGEIDSIRDQFDNLRNRESEIRQSLTPAETMKTVLGETRKMGILENDTGQIYVNESDRSVKTVINEIGRARANLPAEWVEKSNENAILALHVDRGYFNREDDVSTIALSSGGGMHRCAYHELGHHFEDIYPEIKKLEHEFYNRRTAEERLQWLGPGYPLSEKTRVDKFADPYIGKDYGNTEDSGYELFSMGLEGLYCNSYDMSKDTEHQDFVFGILASI